MSNLLTDLIDRAVMAADDDYDPSDYAYDRWQKALHKERQLRNFAEYKAREYDDLYREYKKRPSYDLEAELMRVRREYDKARDEYLRARKATDARQREYINSSSRSDYCTPRYNPDERVRIEDYNGDGDYKPGPRLEKVGKWLDDIFDISWRR